MTLTDYLTIAVLPILLAVGVWFAGYSPAGDDDPKEPK